MFPTDGILSANVDQRGSVRIVTSSGQLQTTSKNFKMTVTGGGCGGGTGADGQRGGAAAGQSIKVFRNIPIGTHIDLVIGASGTGTVNGGAAATAGGTTTVTVQGQTPIVCQGGQLLSVGGTATGGDINITGQRPMDAGFYSGSGADIVGGTGGSTIVGQGGQCVNSPSDSSGKPGTGYGSGGSGGFQSSTTSYTAGNGTQGVCIIEDL